MDKHALYANAEGLTFRVGQPVDWHGAQDRCSRVDDKRVAGRSFTVRHDGRRYKVKHFEVRAVDKHGRGLGSERHATAFPVPYRAMRIV